MWFKQLSFYQVNVGQLTQQDKIKEQLCAKKFYPVEGLAWFNEGFTTPFNFTDDLLFSVSHSWRVSLKKEERVLPAAVIRDALDEKVVEIEETELRHIGRKERQSLKEQITDDLLPRAFTKSSRIDGIFEAQNGFLLVNQANKNRAENFVSQLREALDGLDAKLIQTQQSPSAVMTSWLLQGEAEGNFVLDSDCELKGNGENASIIKISKQDLTADEVVQHIKNGKFVTQLGLIWQDKISFVLTQDLTLKRIRFLDVLQEEAATEGDDVESLATATHILMSETLAIMLSELLTHLGGLIKV